MQKQPTAVSVGRASMTLLVTLVLELNAQQINVFQGVDEFIFVEGAPEALDFEAVVTQ